MNIFVFGGILTSLLTLASGLQCYQCQTLAYKTCRDPYAGEDLGDCDDGTLCTKFKTVVKIRDSGYITGWERDSQVVTRSCEPKKGKKEGCIAWQNNGGFTMKCWCGTDGCNSGRALTPATSSIILSCLISMLVFVLVRLH
ncbi:unnamed protein product [Candidula unifasciata]|uniref:Protein quiver n=1 Tax=Candidula unifasciata TaxID=100452 RepID=A0A8S3Z1K3_9EUPU|nr:unnamed protein product [Candidula unifasciata]